MLAALFAFLHHIAAFTLVSALVVEFLLTKNEPTMRNARNILYADLALGIAAAVILVVGILRVIYFEKGVDYYLGNISFMAKMSLFVLVALLSIYPTMVFQSWRRAVGQGHAPKADAAKMRKVRSIIHGELTGVMLIILFAVLMAKGIG